MVISIQYNDYAVCIASYFKEKGAQTSIVDFLMIDEPEVYYVDFDIDVDLFDNDEVVPSVCCVCNQSLVMVLFWTER